MAEEGYKLKLTAILSANDEGYRRLMHDPEEPTHHKLMLLSTAKTDIGRQQWLTEF